MRLFIAVDPGPEVLSRLNDTLRDLRPRAPHARWVKADNLHLTLAFLGERDPGEAPRIAEALARAAQPHAPLALSFRGGGGFGTARRPRVLWVGCEGQLEALRALHDDVVRSLVPLGFEPERRGLAAHVTLARAKGQGGDSDLAVCAEALAEVDFGEARIGAIRLYESRLSSAGAHYTVVSEAPLGGPPAGA